MNWFCLHTRPLKEREVVQTLGRLGLETYFPRVRRMRRIRRVRKPVTQPLFPRYVFCRFDPTFQFRAARYSRDVLDVVSFGDIPAIVSDALVAELKAWTGETLDLVENVPTLRSGDNVEIADGPFQGLRAVILQETNDADRVAVLFSILATDAVMHIQRSQLMKIT